MKRPLSFAAKRFATLAALLATGAAGAAGAAGGLPSSVGPKTPASNSFNVFYSATAPNAPVVVPSNGTGLPPSKPVVTNPYNVPLIQNAGSLGSVR
jgi:hypothetical protein